MPVLSPVLNHNSICYPLGLQFKLNQVFKDGRKADVSLFNTHEKRLFYGLFDVEDIDLEINVDNKSGQKNIGFEVNHANSDPNQFYIRRGESGTLKALETNGKHLHFLSQGTGDGRLLVAKSSKENKITYKEAAVNCSRITFSVEVEKTRVRPNRHSFPFEGKTIRIKANLIWNSEVIHISVNENCNLGHIRRILKDRGIDSDLDYRIFFDGLRLHNRQTLKSAGIENGSEITLFLPTSGGGIDEDEDTEVEEDEEEDVRGVVCFSQKTDQYFGTLRRFQASEDFDVKPFTIELRLKSKYSLKQK